MVYTINNTEYVLINVLLVESHAKRLDREIKKYEGIIQDFNVLRTNLSIISFIFGSTKIKVSVLIPSKNVKQFSEEVFKK